MVAALGVRPRRRQRAARRAREGRPTTRRDGEGLARRRRPRKGGLTAEVEVEGGVGWRRRLGSVEDEGERRRRPKKKMMNKKKGGAVCVKEESGREKREKERGQVAWATAEETWGGPTVKINLISLSSCTKKSGRHRSPHVSGGCTVGGGWQSR